MKALALLLAALALPAQAVQVGEATLPDQWPLTSLDGSPQTLLLNGAGLREYGPLGIDVYAAALYLTVRESDPQKLLASSTPKVLHMHFFRDGSVEDTRKAWGVYFTKNCTAPCLLPQATIAQFNALLPPTVKGETQTLSFDTQGLALARNGKTLGRIDDADFARLVLATYIGAQPTTQALKKALLGSD